MSPPPLVALWCTSYFFRGVYVFVLVRCSKTTDVDTLLSNHFLSQCKVKTNSQKPMIGFIIYGVGAAAATTSESCCKAFRKIQLVNKCISDFFLRCKCMSFFLTIALCLHRLLVFMHVWIVNGISWVWKCLVYERACVLTFIEYTYIFHWFLFLFVSSVLFSWLACFVCLFVCFLY